VRRDRSPGVGVGKRIEDGEQFLCISPQWGVELTEEFGGQASRKTAGKADRGEAEQRHQRFDAGYRRQAQERAHGSADPAAADQHQALAALGELVGELRRHTSSE
jgi:hypothetical protein